MSRDEQAGRSAKWVGRFGCDLSQCRSSANMAEHQISESPKRSGCSDSLSESLVGCVKKWYNFSYTVYIYIIYILLFSYIYILFSYIYILYIVCVLWYYMPCDCNVNEGMTWKHVPPIIYLLGVVEVLHFPIILGRGDKCMCCCIWMANCFGSPHFDE